jgi:hypothetical protein
MPCAKDSGEISCMEMLEEMFPEACREYLRNLAEKSGFSSAQTATIILDTIDRGIGIPRRAVVGKRKRDTEDTQDSLVDHMIHIKTLKEKFGNNKTADLVMATR